MRLYILTFFFHVKINYSIENIRWKSVYLENQSKRWQRYTKGRSNFYELLGLPSFCNAEVKFSVFSLAAFERTPTSPDYVA